MQAIGETTTNMDQQTTIDVKPCPLCGKTIKIRAVFCKYCRQNISSLDDIRKSELLPQPSTRESFSVKQPIEPQSSGPSKITVHTPTPAPASASPSVSAKQSRSLALVVAVFVVGLIGGAALLKTLNHNPTPEHEAPGLEPTRAKEETSLPESHAAVSKENLVGNNAPTTPALPVPTPIATPPLSNVEASSDPRSLADLSSSESQQPAADSLASINRIPRPEVPTIDEPNSKAATTTENKSNSQAAVAPIDANSPSAGLAPPENAVDGSIGIRLDTKTLCLIEIYPGSDLAGKECSLGDKVMGVNGYASDNIDFLKDKLRGKAGSSVTLTIHHGNQNFDFNLHRHVFNGRDRID